MSLLGTIFGACPDVIPIHLETHEDVVRHVLREVPVIIEVARVAKVAGAKVKVPRAHACTAVAG